MHKAENKENEPEFLMFTSLSKKKVIFAVFIIFSFVLYGWYYYEYKYLPKQPIETILSEDSPIKIKPEKPGGALMPNTDKLVYDNLKSGKTAEGSVSLMPEPEAPIIITKNEEEPEGDKIDDIIGNILSSSSSSSSQDNTKEEEKLSDDINADSTQKSLKIIPVEEHKESKKKTVVSNQKKYYRIQLVSLRNEPSAQKEWERIKKLHPKQLLNMPYLIQKVNVESKGAFYRLLVGQFSSFNQAKALCRKIGHAQNCVIIHH